jgi:DNA repair ATPase RecN
MQQLKDWITGTELDALTLLLGLGAVLLIAAALGMVFATRAQRRRERQSEVGHIVPENANEFTIARWIEEGQQLFNVWQERVAHVTELQSRLDAMAQEIDRLRAQVSRIDDLRAESLRLSQEGEALLLERDQLRSILGRISELAQRASQIRPGAIGETAPEVGP